MFFFAFVIYCNYMQLYSMSKWCCWPSCNPGPIQHCTHYYIPGHPTLHRLLTNVQQTKQTRNVIIWDNGSFHSTALVHNWFTAHLLLTECFSAWHWKDYVWLTIIDINVCMALLQAMEETCKDIDQASCQASIRHLRGYNFLWCLGLEDIACDVNKTWWPNKR